MLNPIKPQLVAKRFVAFQECVQVILSKIQYDDRKFIVFTVDFSRRLHSALVVCFFPEIVAPVGPVEKGNRISKCSSTLLSVETSFLTLFNTGYLTNTFTWGGKNAKFPPNYLLNQKSRVHQIWQAS